LTLSEAYSTDVDMTEGEFFKGSLQADVARFISPRVDPLAALKGKKIAWVGDMNNIAWELMATCPRLGMEMSVATPAGYDTVDDAVMTRL
jgi:ornithine carbamoyltransferase